MATAEKDLTLAGKTTEKQITAYVELSDDEKIKRYRSRIMWAEKDTQRPRKRAEINTLYYRNKPQVFTRGGQKVVVPKALENVDAMFAALTAFAVEPVVTPKGDTTQDMARVQQQALRNEWDELDVLYTTEFQIKDSLVGGIGFVKVGYEFEEEEEEYEVEGETPEGVASQTEVDKVTVRDNATLAYVPWDEVLFDPEAKIWDDVQWVCHRYTMPIEELKADDRFDHTATLGASAYINEKWRGSLVKGEKSENPDEQRVLLYEFHDLVRGTVCWFAEGHEEILRESPGIFTTRMTFRKRNPFIPYIHRKDLGQVWGISDVEAMKPAIDELNVLRSSIATVVERWKPKLLADEGTFTTQGKKALKSSEWGEVVELREGRVLSQSVRPMELPTLPSEFFTQDAKASADADDAIGMTDLLGGQLPVGRKTATAMQQLGQATTVRQSEKRNQLERLYREIADKLLWIMKAYYEQDRVVRMVESMGDVVWEWNNEDISFETGVAVNLEAKEILDADTKREKFLAMLNILGPDPTINKTQLYTYVLRDGLGIPEEIVRLLVKDEQQMEAEAQAAAEAEAAAQGGAPPEGGNTMLDMAQQGSPATAVPTVPQ